MKERSRLTRKGFDKQDQQRRSVCLLRSVSHCVDNLADIEEHNEVKTKENGLKPKLTILFWNMVFLEVIVVTATKFP